MKNIKSYKQGEYGSDFIRTNILSPLFKDVKKISIGLTKSVNIYIKNYLSVKDLSVEDLKYIKLQSLNSNVGFACELISLSDDYFLECKRLVNFDSSQPLHVQKKEIIELLNAKNELLKLMSYS